MTRAVLLLLTAGLCLGCMSVLPSLAPKTKFEKGISAAYLYESKYVDVLGSKMHYVEVGDPNAPPIVLLHGNPTSSYLWRNVMPHLRESGRVIAVDLIGMGKRGKPDIPYRFADQVRYFDAFMEALALKDVVLVLHDWGGGIGFDYAMRHESNIRGIAFMEAVVIPFEWKNLSAPEALLFRTMRSEAGDALMLDENYFVERLVPAFSGRALSHEEMAHYRAPYPKREDRRPTRVWPQEVPFDGEPDDNYTRIEASYQKLIASKVPLLLLLATPGALMSPPVVEKLTTDLPRMTTKDIGPGLHYVQETQPTAIGKSVAVWVAGL